MPGRENELVYDTNTGTLYFGTDRVTTGFVTEDMVNARTMTLETSLADRISYLENELSMFKHRFTADFAKEVIKLCDRFVSEHELTGMTDEEFESELGELLFSGGA